MDLKLFFYIRSFESENLPMLYLPNFLIFLLKFELNQQISYTKNIINKSEILDVVLFHVKIKLCIIKFFFFFLKMYFLNKQFIIKRLTVKIFICLTHTKKYEIVTSLICCRLDEMGFVMEYYIPDQSHI